MRVIKKPQELNIVLWTKQVTCPMCGATLEYTNLDVQKRQCKYNEIEDTIICCNCHKWFCV